MAAVTVESLPDRRAELDIGSSAIPLVSVGGVSRRFGELVALDGVSLRIDRAQIFGLVGPSGSGKTTLVKVIVGLLKPSAGVSLVDGIASDEMGVAEKRRLGYVPQDFSLYPSQTVWENARFMASIYGIGWFSRRRRIREVLTRLEIWDTRDRLAQDLSGGMRRRLTLAGALLHRPDLLVIDEPTAGLDPDLRVRIWDLLFAIQREGTTILMTTQFLEEAERCDAVAILSGGRLVATGSPEELHERASLPGIIEIEARQLSPEVVESLLRVEGVRGVDWNRATLLEIRATEHASLQLEITSKLEQHGCVILSVQSRGASFEEVFSSLVRREQA